MNGNSQTMPFISRQITVYQTDKKLIEFLDKLKSASVVNYAHLHADSEQMPDGRRRISCIGITMLDYSAGIGENKVSVRANLSPDTVLYLFEHIRTNEMWFNFTEDKIFGAPGVDGRMQVTKFRAAHGDPSKRKLPWYMEIANGTGIGQKNKVGGTYMRAGVIVPIQPHAHPVGAVLLGDVPAPHRQALTEAALLLARMIASQML